MDWFRMSRFWTLATIQNKQCNIWKPRINPTTPIPPPTPAPFPPYCVALPTNAQSNVPQSPGPLPRAPKGLPTHSRDCPHRWEKYPARLKWKNHQARCCSTTMRSGNPMKENGLLLICGIESIGLKHFWKGNLRILSKVAWVLPGVESWLAVKW
mgnify:CR=1 FL=1